MHTNQSSYFHALAMIPGKGPVSRKVTVAEKRTPCSDSRKRHDFASVSSRFGRAILHEVDGTIGAES